MTIQKWQCYEEGCEGIYTLTELQKMWDSQIDKSNFADFDSWLEEMEQYQILIRLQKGVTTMHNKFFYIRLLGNSSRTKHHELIEKCLNHYKVYGTSELSTTELHDFCKSEGLL